ncbi:MAG: alanine:cation symporter family protein [Cyanobacteria bacterium SIG30]|nr:alanine:cation symporter family protein [Cyanobacteria bacterium SIG30]
MKFILKIMLALFFFNTQRVFALELDKKIDSVFAPFSDFFSKIVFFPVNIAGVDVPILILLLIFASIFASLYLNGINLWGFGYAVKQIIKKDNNGNSDGEVSSLQALSTALSGTLGLGSIAGVAIAISVGGPGAMFWMFFGAFFGMALKFFECTLAVKYRKFNPDGSISGGPMFYMAHGLTRKGMRKFGEVLALFFAIMCIPGSLGGGNMLQVNQATQQIIYMTGGENSFFFNNAWVCGLILMIIVALIIVGGIKSIANVASKIVPVMCGLYMLISCFIIVINFTNIPEVLYTIIKTAFQSTSVAGGVIGCIIIGMRRSIQSNEAGAGSAPIAYAATMTKEPISQGFVALLEPFFTVVMCSMTASVIIITKQYQNYTDGITGIQLTSSAFGSVSSFFPYILSFVIVLFALSTVISWAYYGQKAWCYIFGEGTKRIKAFQIMFCLFIVIGSSMNLQSVVDFTDATMLAMALPNLITIFILMPEIKQDLKDYCARFKVFNWLGVKINK